MAIITVTAIITIITVVFLYDSIQFNRISRLFLTEFEIMLTSIVNALQEDIILMVGAITEDIITGTLVYKAQIMRKYFNRDLNFLRCL